MSSMYGQFGKPNRNMMVFGHDEAFMCAPKHEPYFARHFEELISPQAIFKTRLEDSSLFDCSKCVVATKKSRPPFTNKQNFCMSRNLFCTEARRKCLTEYFNEYILPEMIATSRSGKTPYYLWQLMELLIDNKPIRPIMGRQDWTRLIYGNSIFQSNSRQVGKSSFYKNNIGGRDYDYDRSKW